MSAEVFITGMGAVSALGSGVPAQLDALRQMRTGIAPITRLETKYRSLLHAGEVNMSNEDLVGQLHIDEPRTWSRTSLLGVLAAREAWAQAQDPDAKARIGLISSTTVGGMDRSERAFKVYLAQGDVRRVMHHMISHDCGDSTERIADDLGIRDFVTTISTACSSSANAILLGAQMIQSGRLDRVVVGGTDALTMYTLNGFHTLKIIDEGWCKPFDENRSGLNLGEGAAYLVLDSERHLTSIGAQAMARVTGFGNANDAYHQTASSPDGRGAYRAMTMALEVAGLSADQIDYVNAHGTATPNNDESEGLALRQLFGDNLPPVSSTKSFTGHTLASAGVIEGVFSILSIQNGFMPANLNFHEPMRDLGLIPILTTRTEQNCRHVLSNSFGFGGNCSTIIFSSV